MDSYYKKIDEELPKIDVPEKYQPYKGVSVNRHKPPREEIEVKE